MDDLYAVKKILFVKYTFASSESFATIDKINGINHPLLYKRFSIVTLLQGIFTILLRRVFELHGLIIHFF